MSDRVRDFGVLGVVIDPGTVLGGVVNHEAQEFPSTLNLSVGTLELRSAQADSPYIRLGTRGTKSAVEPNCCWLDPRGFLFL